MYQIAALSTNKLKYNDYRIVDRMISYMSRKAILKGASTSRCYDLNMTWTAALGAFAEEGLLTFEYLRSGCRRFGRRRWSWGLLLSQQIFGSPNTQELPWSCPNHLFHSDLHKLSAPDEQNSGVKPDRPCLHATINTGGITGSYESKPYAKQLFRRM